MRTALVIFFVAALTGCGGSQDAPRPIADSPQIDGEDPGMVNQPPDDDADGIPNEADLCPLAREDYNASNPDGCPGSTGPDAGP